MYEEIRIIISYSRNVNSFSPQQFEIIIKKKVTVFNQPVKWHGIDDIFVTVDDLDSISSGDVPDDDLVVVARAQQHVFSRWVPFQDGDPPPMTLEIQQVLFQILVDRLQATVRDVPQLDGAIVWSGSDDVVVERVPFNVRHRTRMTWHCKWTRVTLLLFTPDGKNAPWKVLTAK